MIRFFAKHPTAANLLMLMFLLFGLVALPQIKRETFPEFSVPYIFASMGYPGASPEQVEQNLCLRMEEAVEGLSGIDEMRCIAQEGSATLLIKLVSTANTSRALLDIQTQINGMQGLPAGLDPPIVREADWKEPVVDVAISGEMDRLELKAYAEALKLKLKNQYGVSLVEVAGFSDQEIRIDFNESILRELGLSVADVARNIQAQNINIPSGQIEQNNKTFLLRVDQRESDPDALAHLVISSQDNGALVRLGDVADINATFGIDGQKMLFDGQAAAMLKISKNKSDDSLAIKENVAAFVADQQALVPAGVTLSLTNDFSSLLWDRLTMMVRNGWQGVILVFGVMWLFFTLRYSFWVAAGLPVAFFGSFFLMAQFGLSINIMSLVALLMAIGIMMDDAIVIAESIAAEIEKQKPLDDAVIDGVHRVLPGVVSSYLTTVCIFGSLIFLQGEMGAVLRVVPMVLILVLTVSLVEAFLILPHHLLQSLKRQKNQSPPLRFKQSFLARFERFRGGTLKQAVIWAVRWRYGFIGSVFALFFISLALLTSGTLKFVGFPELDGDVAEARVILPPGSSLQQTEAVVASLVKAAERASEQLTETREQGQPLITHINQHFNHNTDADESGEHLATVRVDLLSAEVRQTLMDEFLSEWEKEAGILTLPLSVVYKQPQMGPGGRAIDIRLQHPDLHVLKSVSSEIQTFLRQFHGIDGVLDDMRPGKEEIRIQLREGAAAFGVTAQMIAQQLQSAFFGYTADEIQMGAESIEIRVQMSQATDTPKDLSQFPIVLADGSQIPLAAVARLEYQRNFVRIQRIDGMRTLSVYGDAVQSQISVGDVITQLENDVLPSLRTQYPDLLVSYGGQRKDSATTGSSMRTGFLLGLFGIYVILSFQFRSFREPIVVLLAIPLALIGVLWGHLLLGHPLSMPSLMGFVSLAGVVVNDSILLVQCIRQQLERGLKVSNAVIVASQARFRAVFLTSLTTAVGLLPLLLETSLQAQVVKPLVISIVFGIFTSTLLVLFMIPAAYVVLSDFNSTRLNSMVETNKFNKHGGLG